jgi:hypothetical protein
VPRVYLGHPFAGGYKYGDLALQVGVVSRIGTIKYGQWWKKYLVIVGTINMVSGGRSI